MEIKEEYAAKYTKMNKIQIERTINLDILNTTLLISIDQRLKELVEKP